MTTARCAGFLVLLLHGAAAQVSLNPPKDGSVIAVDVELVNLLCTVRDSRGAFVKGLTKDDFQVFEDGRPQAITHFAREVDSPLTIALLLDVSGSVSGVLTTEKTAARQFFADVLRPGDRALLAGFAESIAVWQDFTPSVPIIQSALARAGYLGAAVPGTRPGAGTRLNDAIEMVASKKLRGITGRKTMVLITDGEDNGSLATAAAAIQAAQEADVVIYAIHFEDKSPGPWLERFGPAALRKLAEPTGGRMFEVTREQPLGAIFDAIAEEMRNQYALAYRPANPTRDGAFHRLEVKTRDSTLKPQSRAGYYAASK